MASHASPVNRASGGRGGRGFREMCKINQLTPATAAWTGPRFTLVTPAKAGTHSAGATLNVHFPKAAPVEIWVPAFAGMTSGGSTWHRNQVRIGFPLAQQRHAAAGVALEAAGEFRLQGSCSPWRPASH